MRRLPDWIDRGPDGAFYIDPDVIYPKIIKLLAIKDGFLDQYWMEVVYQCARLAVEELIAGTELDPRPRQGFVIKIMGGTGRKSRWAHKHYPRGRGLEAAVAVRSKHEPSEAKRHFWRIARELCYN